MAEIQSIGDVYGGRIKGVLMAQILLSSGLHALPLQGAQKGGCHHGQILNH
jgi:hypothetical protein